MVKVVSSGMLVSGVCLAYALAGPTIILVNKHILSDLNFPYPYALTCTFWTVFTVFLGLDSQPLLWHGATAAHNCKGVFCIAVWGRERKRTRRGRSWWYST